MPRHCVLSPILVPPDEVCHYFRWFPSPSFVYFFAPLLLLWQAGIPVQCFVINCNFEITYVAIKSLIYLRRICCGWQVAFLHHGMVGDPDPDDKFFLAGRRESWFSRSTLRCAQNLASKEITWRANGLFGGWEKEQWGLKMNYVRNWENHVLVPPQTDQSCNHTWI